MPDSPTNSAAPADDDLPTPPTTAPGEELDTGDFYFEGPNLVFTAAYHLKRGSCCGSGCRHCPYGNSE
jgi:hypothetical protein